MKSGSHADQISRIIQNSCPGGSLKWPYTKSPTTWSCCLCAQVVASRFDEKNERFYPESNYWNPEHQEVYCSAEHSLAAHEARKHAT